MRQGWLTLVVLVLSVVGLATGSPVGLAQSGPEASPRPMREWVQLTSEEGVPIAVIVNGIDDPMPERDYNKPDGRWVRVDWSIVNQGAAEVYYSGQSLFVQTASEATVIAKCYCEGEFLTYGLLHPEETVRGFVYYDVPLGERIKAAGIQVTTDRRVVIAELTP